MHSAQLRFPFFIVILSFVDMCNVQMAFFSSNKKFENVFRFSRRADHIALIYSIESLILACFCLLSENIPDKCFSLMFSYYAARLINRIIISFLGGTKNAGFFSSLSILFIMSCHFLPMIALGIFYHFHLLLSSTFQFREKRKRTKTNQSAPLLTHKNECQTFMYQLYIVTYESLIILFTFV